MTYDDLVKILGGKTVLSVSWITGGVQGGSCWGTEDHVYSPIDAEPEPSFWEFDTVLEKVLPDVSFLRYKRAVEELVKYEKSTSDDYYGNKTKRMEKYVTVQDMYNYFYDDLWKVKV